MLKNRKTNFYYLWYCLVWRGGVAVAEQTGAGLYSPINQEVPQIR